MIINPLNVIDLLSATFQSMYLTFTPVIIEEVEIKEIIQKILLDCIFQYHTVESLEDSSFDFQELFNDYQNEAIEDDHDGRWTDDEPVKVCLAHDDDIDPEYKRKAVSFWKQGEKQYRKLSTVQQNFRLVSSERQLRRWIIQIETGGNKREVLMRISEYVLNEFRSAVNTGRIVHDRDLRL